MDVRSTIFKLPHHFLIICTLVKLSSQTSKHWQLTSMEQICFARIAPSYVTSVISATFY